MKIYNEIIIDMNPNPSTFGGSHTQSLAEKLGRT